MGRGREAAGDADGAAAGAALERAEDVERGERCCDDDVHVGFTVKRARITTQIHHRNGAEGGGGGRITTILRLTECEVVCLLTDEEISDSDSD